MGAQLNGHPNSWMYFVTFVVVGSFFTMGLLVGVVVDQYSKQQEKFTGALDLTDDQRNYLQALPPHAPA